MTNIINKIKNGGFLLGALLLFLSIVPFSSVLGANVFNSNPADYPLRVSNNNQSEGTQNWQTSLSGVNAGNSVEFSVYFHNAGDIPATNTNVRLQLSPTGSSTSFTATSTISATSFSNYVTNATIGLTSSQSINFISTAKLYTNYNGSNYQVTTVPVSVSGNVVTYNLGTVNQGYAPNDGYINFMAQVSNNTTPTGSPVVSAGPSKTITSGQSTTLNGTASHPDGLSMTYQWSCNGGSLSNSTALQPTFYAPSVSSTQTYNCTLTARDSNNNTASSVVYITVNPIAPTGSPVVSAGPSKTITSGQSTTLNGTASHPDGLSMTYQWSCNGGSLSNSTALQPTFYAPSVSATQTYNCTLTARDSNNNTASSVVYITVNPIAPTGSPVVSAGPSKTITSGQSTTLNGTASHPDGLSMTYQWSCNGGSLSNSTALQPTFYAPSVSATQTYNCTLTARDSNNNTASSVVYITVNPIAPTGSPVVSAGPSKTITSGQSTTLNGTASHPDGLSMTYQWSCNGGSLSNSTALQPTFYAPSVSATQTYNCTLTARDSNNNTASSVVYITVNPIAPTGSPVVSAGPSKTITSGQSTTLNGTASHPDGLSMTYQWSCNNGSISSSTSLRPVFYAPSVSSTTTYSCTLTARDSNNNTASSVTYITVNPTNYGGGNIPVVNAGGNRTVNSGQAVTLEGTAYHPNNLYMTYQWSCNGGSLSYSTQLRPTFYAPSISYTTTYSCTLTARDTNNNTASSVTYITVNPTSTPTTGYPSVNAGPSKTITSGQSTTLEGTANHSSGLSMTYQWSCNNGSISSSTSLRPVFYAPSVSSTTTYSCTLTARDSNNNTASSVTYITVNPTNYGGGNIPVVNAGGNRTVNSGQAVTLEGTAYHPNNLYMTYQWSCNGGSLSYSTQLRPTFYAPSISYTTTYSCTLTARDNNNNSASSVAYITVNPSGYTGGNQDFNVSTHVAENVTSTSATLKGKIDSDYGRNVSVRFSWGTASSQYTNHSPWQYNKRTGDIVSFNITGLQKGKAYHYRLEASDGSRNVYGQNVSFVTKTDSVSGFTALASGSNRINLTWNSAPQSCYTMIVRKTGGYPQHGADGTVIYYGTGNSYLDTGVTNNLWYYYKAWAVGCDQGLFSFSKSVYSRAYTVSGQIIEPATPTTPVATTVSNANVEILARNISKDQFSWQNSIIASKGDKIEFKIVITPMGNKSLEDVRLMTSFSDKIKSIENLVVDGSTSYFNLDRETSFGNIKLGESRVITFTGTMDNFNNQIINSIEVSAKGVNTIRKDLTINTTSFQQGAAFMDMFGSGIYGWLLLILIILMVLVMMYLILERNRMLLKKEEEVKVEKSKYFNIK